MSKLKAITSSVCAMSLCILACGQGGPRPSDLGASKLDPGEPGIAWYTTWESGLSEAKRSGRPIMFVAAATQCHGVSGVFWPGYTATQNGLFASDEFIEASRGFVCVRIDSYESAEHQKYVRTFLDGRFENSAFCLLSPDGQDWLSKAGRGPEMVLGRSFSSCVERMEIVAALYPAIADVKQAEVQDFHSVRQALNVAAADQRVLVVVNGPGNQIAPLRKSLRSVASDERILGRFHIDFEEDEDWRRTVTGVKDGPGIVIIRPGEFGMDGTAMNQLPLNTDSADILTAMLSANTEFAASTEKKVYSVHVDKGQELGIYFEGAVPYGEDRDGDGEIDRGRSSRPRGGRPRR